MRTNLHGSVCIYISETLIGYEVDIFSSDEHEEEQVWRGIKKVSDSILVWCIYRPSDSTYVRNNKKI